MFNTRTVYNNIIDAAWGWNSTQLFDNIKSKNMVKRPSTLAMF